jgi:chromosome segregation ATPase
MNARQMVEEVERLGRRLSELEEKLSSADHALEAFRSERSDLEKQMGRYAENIDRVLALEEKTRQDARDILKAERDRIDPRDAVMPQALRDAGFGVPA